MKRCIWPPSWLRWSTKHLRRQRLKTVPFLNAKFDFYQKVQIDGDINGVITMIRFHPKEMVDYLVAWWSSGDMREQWIDEERLTG